MEKNSQNNGLARLVQNIEAVRDDDLWYDEAMWLMQRCADELLSDDASQAQYPQLWQFFRLNPECYEEYQMLMDLARLEAAGGLIQPVTIPPMPSQKPSGIGSWFNDTKEAMTALFSGFSRQVAMAHRSLSTTLKFEPVEVELDDGALLITFDVEVNATDQQRRNLHCWVETEEEAVEAQFEASPVWLQQGYSQLIVQEQALNELGDVTFSLVSSGEYTFRLYLAGQEYVVEKLVLP